MRTRVVSYLVVGLFVCAGLNGVAWGCGKKCEKKKKVVKKHVEHRTHHGWEWKGDLEGRRGGPLKIKVKSTGDGWVLGDVHVDGHKIKLRLDESKIKGWGELQLGEHGHVRFWFGDEHEKRAKKRGWVRDEYRKSKKCWKKHHGKKHRGHHAHKGHHKKGFHAHYDKDGRKYWHRHGKRDGQWRKWVHEKKRAWRKHVNERRKAWRAECKEKRDAWRKGCKARRDAWREGCKQRRQAWREKRADRRSCMQKRWRKGCEKAHKVVKDKASLATSITAAAATQPTVDIKAKAAAAHDESEMKALVSRIKDYQSVINANETLIDQNTKLLDGKERVLEDQLIERINRLRREGLVESRVANTLVGELEGNRTKHLGAVNSLKQQLEDNVNELFKQNKELADELRRLKAIKKIKDAAKPEIDVD